MKDFLVMCAKIGLGLFIGFVLIYGGANSMKNEVQEVYDGAVKQFDIIQWDITN